MMGYQQPVQNTSRPIVINLEQRIRKNHPLRKIKELIDFEFIYDEVKETYGIKGNVSVPPTVILRLMLLLVMYKVRSERELMETLPERLDWLWFLDYELDTPIPDHSVLSKARKRWGPEVFKAFFERVVLQCMNAGLIDGSKVFCDSSLVDANASNNSVIDTKDLRHQLSEGYKKLESRLEELSESADPCRSIEGANSRYLSSTDPDAAIVNRGKAALTYQVHRAVDEAYEIITATETTAGDVNEAHIMIPLIEQHEAITEKTVETVVADSKYGTIENFLTCHDRGIQAHMPDLGVIAVKRAAASKLYGEECFRYDSEKDVYNCPAGNELKPKSLHMGRQSKDYAAPKRVCSACHLRGQCTRNKSGRTIKRHLRQEELDMMRRASRSAKAKRDIRTRQHLMERSFARGKRYGFDHARWRGLWRVRIQELLTCAIQNIDVLIKHVVNPKKCAMTMKIVKLTSMGKPVYALNTFGLMANHAVAVILLCIASGKERRTSLNPLY